MILLTIGTQLPFDRLVREMDAYAASSDEDIFGQIGKAAGYIPQNFAHCLTMNPKEFEQKFASARVIVSHAGIGTILTARKHGKPIIVFPRQAKFGEHRNDHQLATCQQLGGKAGIYPVENADMLRDVLSLPNLEAPAPIDESPDRAGLLNGIRHFTSGLQRPRASIS
ncbi:glucuronosyltransferase [Rhizobium sp. CG5]|uniref:glycosyltransferase n=1 Tax=Rhizobium sp. CG5 TaxID=2726076 RepID=UPI0020340A30|nr:glycosyltransferase [Rhizobium sp. CG5]MCM2476294.1 glucuronosyltransferase [Rhizobium sp. CG5]